MKIKVVTLFLLLFSSVSPQCKERELNSSAILSTVLSYSIFSEINQQKKVIKEIYYDAIYSWDSDSNSYKTNSNENSYLYCFNDKGSLISDCIGFISWKDNIRIEDNFYYCQKYFLDENDLLLKIEKYKGNILYYSIEYKYIENGNNQIIIQENELFDDPSDDEYGSANNLYLYKIENNTNFSIWIYNKEISFDSLGKVFHFKNKELTHIDDYSLSFSDKPYRRELIQNGKKTSLIFLNENKIAYQNEINDNGLIVNKKKDNTIIESYEYILDKNDNWTKKTTYEWKNGQKYPKWKQERTIKYWNFGILNDSKVRLRDQPNLESNTLGNLNKGDKVEVLAETQTPEKIGDMESVWYKVKTTDGTIGWAYGWFIDIEE